MRSLETLGAEVILASLVYVCAFKSIGESQFTLRSGFLTRIWIFIIPQDSVLILCSFSIFIASPSAAVKVQQWESLSRPARKKHLGCGSLFK